MAPVRVGRRLRISTVRRVPLLVASFGLWAPAPAYAENVPRMTAAEAEAAELALSRGALLYAYDRAAWHGTDDLRAKLPDYSSKVGGWVVDGPTDSPFLVFFDRNEADPKALYVARFRGAELIEGRLLDAVDDRSLSPERKAMIAARRAATDALVASKASLCKEESLNTVVLPPTSPGASTFVYFLTPQTNSKAIPLGGHFRVEVGPDGRARKPRAFTNTCLEMPIEDESGGRPEVIGISHLLDRAPTEIHVFSSLAAKLPLFVIITKTRKLWSVEGNRVRILSNDVGR